MTFYAFFGGFGVFWVFVGFIFVYGWGGSVSCNGCIAIIR